MMYDFNETPITYQMWQFATRNSDFITDVEQDAIDLMHKIELRLINRFGDMQVYSMLRSLVWCLRATPYALSGLNATWDKHDHKVLQHWIDELFGASGTFDVEFSVAKVFNGYTRLRMFES